MTDYDELGFKCGIEIHQQLEGKKLFCNCPALNSDKKPDVKVMRRLRAVAGETGFVDEAARHEMEKGKYFVYTSNSEDTCLVEYDEMPPFPINNELVDVAVTISLMLNAKVVDEVQVMRKTVVDGSNTAGFQRTALIARNGYIETSKGVVRIPIICLEEEAAQKIKDTKDCTEYKLDRLGIALIEIGTAPDIKDPEHAKETAEKIGLILRSTGKVKRGLGTIRQDVNVSVKDGARTEIKGFQDLRSIPKVIESEVKRQVGLIKEGKKPKNEVRKAEPDFSTSFLRPMPGAARMYPETDVLPLKVEITKAEKVELIEEKAKRFEKLGLGNDLAKVLAKSEKAGMFDRFASEFKNIKPAFIAETITAAVKEIRRKYDIDADKITETEFEEIFKSLDEGRISKDIVIDVLIDYAKGTFKSFDSYSMISDEELEKELKKFADESKNLPFGALMGKAMARFRGKADGKKISEILKRLSGQ